MNKFIVACMPLIFLLSPLTFAEKKYEVVNVKSFLNIRSGPGTIYSILRAIPNTEKNITIVDSKQLAESKWLKIKHNDEYGWVNEIYLKVSLVDDKKTDTNKNEEETPLWLAMSGVYSLTNITPIKGENMDTHMLFQLEAAQAKVIYDAIKTPAFTDKCTGAMAKKIGEMLCLYYPHKHVQEEISTVSKENTVLKRKDNLQEKELELDSVENIKAIYECHFSINIMQQKIQQGIPCVE